MTATGQCQVLPLPSHEADDVVFEYDRLAAARRWQDLARAGKYPSLRCKQDGTHQPLDPSVDGDGRAVLICPDCGYALDEIPEPVVRAWRQACAET